MIFNLEGYPIVCVFLSPLELAWGSLMPPTIAWVFPSVEGDLAFDVGAKVSQHHYVGARELILCSWRVLANMGNNSQSHIAVTDRKLTQQEKRASLTLLGKLASSTNGSSAQIKTRHRCQESSLRYFRYILKDWWSGGHGGIKKY